MKKKSQLVQPSPIEFVGRRGWHSPDITFREWLLHTVISGVIFSILLFILVNFYIFSSIVSLDSFLFVFLVITILTDGFFLLLQLFRRPVTHDNVSVDPEKVSAIIACYNGADVIGETIEHLTRQIPAKNIIVVSDASTDNTEEIARSFGAQVFVNTKNVNKAFSISMGVHHVKTPYTLILDDDVLIGDATIPTSLLDEGYSAAAFSVMPIKTDTFVNALEMFEYRNSMHIGKSLRARVDAIGNISGAIGLFRTRDLQAQATLHSGQFAGEDEQRTLLTHIYAEGKGITYAGETVYTHVPNTFYSLYRQRAYSWSLSVPELFIMYLRIIFSPRYHFLLKAEKAYYVYIYLTDPLRLLFLWTLFLRPQYLLLTYLTYLAMNTFAWLKTGRKDPFMVILVYPLYTLWLGICRFVGNFYWFKVKADYFAKGLHQLVTRRKMRLEFAGIVMVFVATWLVSGYHFMSDLQLFNKIQSSRLDETAQVFNYDNDATQPATTLSDLSLTFSQTVPAAGTYTSVTVEKGDTIRSIAHKAVDRYVTNHTDIRIPYSQRRAVDQRVESAMRSGVVYYDTKNSAFYIDNASMDSVFSSEGAQ